MPKRIFVQIASYRDPQLGPTLHDCLEKSRHPENLTFGICCQWDSEDNLDRYWRDPRFKFITVPFQHSRGVCWARHHVQCLYDGEEYTIQLDSHHRFAENWDQECIEMVEDLRREGVAKPLLTAYLPSFDPTNDPAGRSTDPLQMVYGQFAPEGPVSFRPEVIENHQSLTKPIPARFFSAHFVFTLGVFCTEVPYDPSLYFLGEEASLAVRAFTYGYDLFHPHKVLAWHHYIRPNQSKHWTDHEDWPSQNENSYRRFRALFGMDGAQLSSNQEKYGFGDARTLQDYEKYAGICFGLRGVDKYTLSRGTPPTPYPYVSEEQWQQCLLREQHFTIALDEAEVPQGVSDYDFWFVGAHNSAGDEIFREDMAGSSIDHFIRSSPCEKAYVVHLRDKVASWTVWPHSRSQGWLGRITKAVS